MRLAGNLFTQTTITYTKGGTSWISGFYIPWYAVASNTTDLSYIARYLGFELRPVEIIDFRELSSNYNMTETDWASLDFPCMTAGQFCSDAYGD